MKVIALLSIAFGVLGAAPNPSHESCRQNLISSVKAEIPYQPWAELPQAVSSFQHATLLVRVDFGGHDPALEFLEWLTRAEDGLAIPGPLRTMVGTNLVFVVSASKTELLSFYHRLMESAAGPSTSFRLLDSASSHPPVLTPTATIYVPDKMTTDSLDAALKERLAQNANFSVVDIQLEQTFYFLPKSDIDDYLPLLRAEGVRARTVPVVKDWTKWLLSKVDPFEDKVIYLTRDWAVVSKSTYKILFDLARTYGPTWSNEIADTRLIDSMNHCFDLSCQPQSAVRPVTTAIADATPAPPKDVPTLRESMDSEAQALIAEFLKAHRGRARFGGVNGFRKVFLQLAKFIKSPAAAQTYRDEIRAIPFTTYEMQSYRRSPAAKERFLTAWRAFLRAMNSPIADRPVTYQSVSEAITEMEVPGFGNTR